MKRPLLQKVLKTTALSLIAIVIAASSVSCSGTDSRKSPPAARGTGAVIVTPGGSVATASPDASGEPVQSDLTPCPAAEDPHTQTPGRRLDIDPSQIHSRSVIMKDITTGEIVCSLSPEMKIFPASMTKIMTGLLAAELIPDGAKITVTAESIDKANSLGASTAGFAPGEITDKEGIIAGILMSSAAECSITAAVLISGSEEAFASLMNERAAAYGMSGTHFVNCTGLHDDQHYTTASDLLKLTEAALSNPTFRRFFTEKEFVVNVEPPHKYPFTLVSLVHANAASFDYGKVVFLGGKTGYTRQAGLCLASYAAYGGHEYILITGANDGSRETEKYHFTDAAVIYGALQEAER